MAQVEDFTAEDIDRFVALGLRSSVIVPLTGSGGAVLGALTLVTAESGMVFDDQDVALAVEVARGAGAAVESAQLYARVEHAAPHSAAEPAPARSSRPRLRRARRVLLPVGGRRADRR